MCFRAASNSSIKMQVLRVRSSSCAMPLYTLEMKAKILLLGHHYCNLRLDYRYFAYITQVYCKEIKSVPSGLLEHTLYKYTWSVFQIGCVFFCFVLLFFFTKQFMQSQSTWQKNIFCFLHGSNAIHCDFTHHSYETLLNWTVSGKEKTRNS